MREVSTSEALMTDPTTPEGAAYWQERHDYEEALERMSTEATWLHLSIAHGFYDWHSEQVAERYAGLVRSDGAVDVVGLHQRDHELHAQDLDHDHQEET